MSTAQALAKARENVHGVSVKFPTLVISPETSREFSASPLRRFQIYWSEHPLPGEGSFAAGAGLLEFFDTLRREKSRRLEVFLSGGASSLAWLPFPGVSTRELNGHLARLYGRPFSIERLNRERARLDQLKAGGAARWLHTLAPEVRARVWVVSDVLPFGPRVVGSGPFWDGRIPHNVVADNRSWVRGIARVSRGARLPVAHSEAGRMGLWSDWVTRVEKRLRTNRRFKQELMIFGGEPQVDLSRSARLGCGGRQTQIAAALLQRYASEIASGQLEFLCLSSDGVDGRSGAAGAWLRARAGQLAIGYSGPLARALERLDSAAVLRRFGALVPSWETGTNVQDVVLVRRSGA